MPTSSESDRRGELAAFLRARRGQLQPEQVGLTRQGRRRVTGLRRHEVADLAGVSDTWYTWLEQGRDIRVSSHMLDAVARALRLDEDERRYVRQLADIPVVPSEPAPPEPHPHLLGLLEDLLPVPAFLTTAAWDILAWNRTADCVFAESPGDFPPEQRNGLWILFMGRGREVLEDWNREKEALVGRFRIDAAEYPGDPRFQSVVDTLSEASEEFRSLWGRHEVRAFGKHALTLKHPEVGLIGLHLVYLCVVDQPGLMLKVFRPVDEASKNRIGELRAGGPERPPVLS